MRVGYVGVSTEKQNTARQEVLMQELGVERVYLERVSGKTQKGREELNTMLEYVREGDAVVVEFISRIARNTRDLLKIVERLEAKGVEAIKTKSTLRVHIMAVLFMGKRIRNHYKRNYVYLS